MGTTGTTVVAFSAGVVLFNISLDEPVSLIVVIGRSEVVGVCACIEVGKDSIIRGIVAITIVIMNIFEAIMIY